MTEKEWRRIFANRVLQRLGELDMSQEDLALEAGIAPCSVSYYLTLRRTPNAVIIANLALALKVSSAWLIDVGETVERE